MDKKKLYDQVTHHYADIYEGINCYVVAKNNLLQHLLFKVKFKTSDLSFASSESNSDSESESAIPTENPADYEIDKDDSDLLIGGGAVVINGLTILVYQWLGNNYTERIVSRDFGHSV
jgi:hypothetical protein